MDDIHVNFWDVHGLLFLIGLVLFPRITVVFFSQIGGGLIFWIVFLLFPRIVIPIMAAYYYWDTNPGLVVLSFLISLSTETGEKTVMRKAVVRRRHEKPVEFIDI